MPKVIELKGSDRFFKVKPVKKEEPEKGKEAKDNRSEGRTVKQIGAAQKKEKIRVAAYCRVSTLLTAQEGSIQAQKEHYEKVIRGNEEWELAGIYLDQGISGTKAETRPELQRMMADCRGGRINLILTKSISRFARNTVECLEMVRELSALGVAIRFEKEHIDTGTVGSEFILSIMATIAQDESKSISKNLKWGIKRRFENDTYLNPFYPFGYGKGWVVVPEEAEVVKGIFGKILEGKGLSRIASELNEEGVKTRNGNEWTEPRMGALVRNRAYTGDLLYQKSYTDEGYSQKKNRGEINQYLSENHHEGIISREVFEKAQEIIEWNKDRSRISGESKRRISGMSGKVICSCCGKAMHKKGKHFKCIEDRSKCSNLPEQVESIQNTFITCLNKLSFCPEVLEMHEAQRTESERRKNQERLIEIDSRLEKNRKELKLITAESMIDYFNEKRRSRKQEILTENEALLREKEHLMIPDNGERMIDFVRKWTGDEFPEEAFAQYVDRAVVLSGESVVFQLKCGLALEESLRREEE